MISNEELVAKIEALPDAQKVQVANFIEFLELRYKPERKIEERQFGIGKGSFEMAPDFDEPMEEFKDYM